MRLHSFLCLLSLATALRATPPNAFQATIGSTVSIFNTSTFTETSVIGFPPGPVNRLVITPDNSRAFMAGYYTTRSWRKPASPRAC